MKIFEASQRPDGEVFLDLTQEVSALLLKGLRQYYGRPLTQERLRVIEHHATVVLLEALLTSREQ